MRDRDVRNAIVTALEATHAFDANGVWLQCPEDMGEAAGITRAVSIEPGGGSWDDKWDTQTTGGIVISSMLKIIFYCRNQDPQLRDEGAELLWMSAMNALNGQSLAGLTIPEFTHFVSWPWANPAPPERQIQAVFKYEFIVEGWDAFDVINTNEGVE